MQTPWLPSIYLALCTIGLTVSPRKYRKYLIKFQSLCHIKRGNSKTFLKFVLSL